MVKFSRDFVGVYKIAEVGLNHNGDLKSALDHVKAAKSCGCDAVKFQTYITEKRVKDPESPLRPILKKLELSYSDFTEIKNFADSEGIEFFSTAFDQEAVSFLTSIGVDLFKVASFDTSNDALFDQLIGRARRVIFSTGMTDMATVNKLIDKLTSEFDAVGVLHCVSSYPTPPSEARLSNISVLLTRFRDAVIGYSDHTQGIIAPVASVGLGARVIEKHFKVSDEHECVDAAVSMGPGQMRDMVEMVDTAYEMLGDPFFGISEVEKEIAQFRRLSL